LRDDAIAYGFRFARRSHRAWPVLHLPHLFPNCPTFAIIDLAITVCVKALEQRAIGGAGAFSCLLSQND